MQASWTSYALDISLAGTRPHPGAVSIPRNGASSPCPRSEVGVAFARIRREVQRPADAKLRGAAREFSAGKTCGCQCLHGGREHLAAPCSHAERKDVRRGG